jgi:hypothetical protein
MPGQDTSSFQEAMKTVTEGGIIDLIHTKAPFAEKFKAVDAKKYGGREVVRTKKITRSQGIGAAGEMGAIAAAGRAKYAQRIMQMRYLYARVQFSAQVMKASQGDRFAHIDVVTSEMDDVIDGLQNECGRIVWGDGRGIMAFVNDTTPSGSATVGIDSPGGFAGATNGGRFLNEGMVVGFINPATGTLRAGIRTVQSVASDGTSVTLDSAPGATVADNDYIVRAANTTVTDVIDSAYQKEPMGAAGHFDDGTYVATYFNINRTTVPLEASTVISNTGAWSSDVTQRLIDVVAQVGGSGIDELWMHQSGRRAYVESMKDDRRYMGADLLAPDGGTRAAAGRSLTFGTVPIKEDRTAPYGIVWALSSEAGYERYEMDRGSWINEDGSTMKILGTGNSLQDAFEMVYRLWFNNSVEKSIKCGRLDGLDVQVAVAHVY